MRNVERIIRHMLNKSGYKKRIRYKGSRIFCRKMVQKLVNEWKRQGSVWGREQKRKDRA